MCSGWKWNVPAAFKSIQLDIITSPVIYFYFCIHKPIKSNANVIQIGMSTRKTDGLPLSLSVFPTRMPALCSLFFFFSVSSSTLLYFALEGMWIILLRYWSWQAVAASGSTNSITQLSLINGDCAGSQRTSAHLGSYGDPLQWLFLL